MQIIPSASVAASAAGTAAQSSSKDRGSSSGQAADSAATPAESFVERSGTANPDRDAQGQGDGLPGESKDDPSKSQHPSSSQESPTSDRAPNLPGEPPSQLDIVG